MKKAIIMLFLLSTSVLFSQELWNGINYGMSEKEIRVKINNLVKPTIKEKEDYGKDIILKLENYIISDDRYDILFYSKNDELYEIIIRPVEKNLNSKDVKILYDKLSYLLRKKYGKDNSLTENKKTNSSIIKQNWIVGSIKIELFMTYFSSSISGISDITELFVAYTKFLVQDDSNKL